MTIDSGITYTASEGGISTSLGNYVITNVPAPDTPNGYKRIVSSWSSCSGVSSDAPSLVREWTRYMVFWQEFPPGNIYDRNNYHLRIQEYELTETTTESAILDIIVLSNEFPNSETNGIITIKVKWKGAFAALQVNLLDKPSYFSLIDGYRLDARLIPQSFVIASEVDKQITIKYYRENRLEPIPGLKSLIWSVQLIDLQANIPQTILTEHIVLGTLHVNDASISSQIRDLIFETYHYPYRYLFSTSLPDLYSEWNALYNTLNVNTTGLPVFPEARLLRKLSANNNIWSNAIPGIDINFDIEHPMFEIDNERAFDWHVRVQSNDSYGNLIMDSPRTIESHAYLLELRKAFQAQNYQTENLTSDPQVHHLDWYIKNTSSTKLDEVHTALNASQYLIEVPATIGTGTIDTPETPALHKLDYYIKNTTSNKLNDVWKALGGNKYAVNDIDSTKDRVTNLGYLVENLARVNGLRFDANGNIDLAKEKSLYQPRTIANPSLGAPTIDGKYNNYGMSCFGTIGMLVPHLPTTYGKNGKQQQLFDVVHDHQQLAIAILRQQDVSLSIQHGSEIRVTGLDGKVHAYPNQLAVSLECLQRLEKIKYMTERNLLISTTAGTEIRELFSGIGIPVTQKFMPLKDPSNSKRTLSLPYFGHQKNKPSTAQLLTTVHVNLAVINGVLMPKKQPEKADLLNPFKHFNK